MTRSTRRPSLLAAAAAALCLAAVAVAAPQAAAAATRSHFQEQVTLSCEGGGSCVGSFINLPANQALDVDHVWCEVLTTGTLGRAFVYAAPAAPLFQIPLSLLWQRTQGTTRIYTLGGEMNMRVPLGKTLTVVITYGDGSPYGNCSFTGERIIQ